MTFKTWEDVISYTDGIDFLNQHHPEAWRDYEHGSRTIGEKALEIKGIKGKGDNRLECQQSFVNEFNKVFEESKHTEMYMCHAPSSERHWDKKKDSEWISCFAYIAFLT